MIKSSVSQPVCRELLSSVPPILFPITSPCFCGKIETQSPTCVHQQSVYKIFLAFGVPPTKKG